MHNTMRRNRRGTLAFYTSTRLALRHAFTTKAGGVSTGVCESLNLGFSRGDLRENVLKNYEILTKALDMPLENLTMTRQVHSDMVAVVTEESVGAGLHKPILWDADALITNLPGVPLAGYYADCVVALLYDPYSQSCGVCHAGWRGTALGILPAAAEKMAQHFGARRENIIAVIGPSIGQCCFETDADVPTAMEQQMGAAVREFVQTRGEKFHVDLQGINAALLQRAGLAPENVVVSGICTRCHSDEFWSHRATNGKRGVQAGIICL